MSALHPTTVISRSPEAVHAGAPPELLMMHILTGRCICLDDVGYRIWQLLESPRAFSDLVAQVAVEFSAPYDVLGADVSKFVLEMQSYELMVLAPASSG